MNIAGFGNLVACYCAFDYRWRPVARDEGDPPFSWSLSFVLGIRGSNAGGEAQARAARSRQAVGWAGVHSIIALLLALEARLYVVTAVGRSSSNLSSALQAEDSSKHLA